jgi:hypothetical protein
MLAGHPYRKYMDGSGALSIAALVIALIAIVISSILARQAVRENQNANHMHVTADLLKNHRTPDFVRTEITLWDELPKHDPALGFVNLPEPVRGYAVDVGMYYQVLAYVSQYGLADSEFIGVQTKYRLLRSWECIAAHVKGERDIRGAENSFLNSYEAFAARVAQMDVDQAQARLVARGRGRGLW